MDRSTPVEPSGGLRFVDIAAGNGFTCGVTPEGQAFCWGDNTDGQLGIGGSAPDTCLRNGISFECSQEPLPVAGDREFAAIGAGTDYACALTPSGAAFCWGSNTLGALGDGTDIQRRAPTPVSGGVTFRTIDGGSWSTCGLRADGQAYCWGSNFAGELGTGEFEGPEVCGFVDCSTVPVPVTGDFEFETLSVGGGHVCGVATDGVVYCWGSNSSGRLGDGTNVDARAAPTPVLGQ